MNLGRHGRLAILAMAPCVVLVASGCGEGSVSSRPGQASTEAGKIAKGEPRVQLPRGAAPRRLVVKDLRVGDGKKAKAGDELVTRFVAVYVTGERFESTWEAGRKPFRFELGAAEANPGWERGLRGMRVGGRRELIVPPRLSSQDRAATEGGPEKTLVYVIDLLAAASPGAEAAARGAEGGGGMPTRSRVDTSAKAEPDLTLPEGPPPRRLVKRDLITGTGPTAEPRAELTVEYVAVQLADEAQIGNSWVRSKPFEFTLGTYHPFVSPGWHRGIRGMRVGGRRELLIPPDLLYVNRPPSGSAPRDMIVYLVDLVAAQR